MELSIVMVCLNEEKTVGACVKKALKAIRKNMLEGEIILVDNGSADKSAEIAEREGARVILENNKGYGRAYRLGISAANGRYVIIGDSDATYDFSEIMKFVKPLREGYEFVNGSRIKGKIHKGAMPVLHRYIGNPMFSFILNLFFKTNFSDAYCGIKAFRRQAYERMKFISLGMEFSLELIINASRLGLKRTEVPVVLHTRKGVSKLRTFVDGWRSLALILIYSPSYLFFVPGIMAFSVGFIGVCLYVFSSQMMTVFMISVLSGFLLINIGFLTKSYVPRK